MLLRTFGESTPEILAVFFFVFLVAFVVLKNLVKPSQRRNRPGSQRSPWTNTPKLKVVGGKSRKPYQDMSDPSNQMDAVSRVRFRRKKLLNGSEDRLFNLVNEILQSTYPDLRLMAQTSLGEVIEPVSQDKRHWSRAQASVNSKRLDMAIFNTHGMLLVAIEFQGSGHYSQKTFMRDAVKKEALRRAGVALVEVPKNYSPESINALLRQHLPSDGSTSRASPKT